MRFKTSIDIFTIFCFFVTCTDFFTIFSDSLVECLEISKDEFRINDLDIALGIDRATDMMNIGIIKMTNNLEDSIHIANM